MARANLVLACVIGLAAGVVRPLEAQRGWDVEGEVGASLFFGNTDQTLVTTRAAAGHADSTAEFSGDVKFTYGEATDDEGATFVNKRSWQTNLNANYLPFAPVSPFLHLSVESSFEKKIDARYNGGVGGKFKVTRTARTTVDLSLAFLGERVVPDERAVDGPDTFARWQARAHGKHSIGDGRLTLSADVRYRPQLDWFGNFTLSTTTSLGYQLSSVVSLKLSFVDNYDSEATARGARSNNDGQVFFAVLGSF